MAKKAVVKYRSLRSNLVHLPLSLFGSLAQQQVRPQGIILHIAPLASSSSRHSSRSAYLGWSGLAAASSLAGIGGGMEAETVEMDPEVAMGLHWAEGTIVEISIIHSPVKAKSVSVTPLSSDDWEILEQQASYLENNLLSQLRAAQSGQEIDIWVMGKSKIRIRVDETNPPTTPTSPVLIHPDTEIFVAPRPRQKGSTDDMKPKTIVNGSTPKVEADPMSSRSRSVEMRFIPSRIVQKWPTKTLIRDEEAAVHGQSNIVLGSRQTIRRIRRKLQIEDRVDQLWVKVCRKTSTDASGTGSDWSAEMEQSVSEDPESQEESVESCMLEWEEVPPGCLVVSGQLGAAWDRWARVIITCGQNKKGRIKSAANNQSLIDFSASKNMESQSLFGVHEILGSATGYLKRSFHVPNPRPLLLIGGNGNGKTTLAKAIGRLLENDKKYLTEVIYHDAIRVDRDSKLGGNKEKISTWLDTAKDRQPSLLILDNLDMLIAPENELQQSSTPDSLAAHFCHLVTDLPSEVLTLVTSTSSTSLHPLINTNHVFGETLKIPMPDKGVRRDVFQCLAQNLSTGGSSVPIQDAGQEYGATGKAMALDFVTLSSMTEGYSHSDMRDLMDNAMQQSFIRNSKVDERMDLIMEDFEQAQASFTPRGLRGVSLQKSDTSWSDIGGMREPRRVLRETLEWPTKYAQIFKNCPLRLRSGLLLYGFPGCGKTLLASAVAKECGLNFISVKGPEILNKYIGASELAVRNLFERASAAKPCVLFFDEFDSIAPKRGHDSTGVTDRVVNQMLTEMDGAQGLEGVYVLAATSRPDLIDPALLRPGRLDKSLLCDMPDYQDRLDILRALSRKLSVGSDVALDQLAVETEGFSGADLQAMLYNAHLEVVHASLNQSNAGGKGTGDKGKTAAGKGKGKAQDAPNGNHVEASKLSNGFRQLAPPLEKNSDRNASRDIAAKVESLRREREPLHQREHVSASPTPVIHQVHLLRSLENTRPSVSPTDRARLERIYQAFVSDRDGTMMNGDLGRATGTRMSLQ